MIRWFGKKSKKVDVSDESRPPPSSQKSAPDTPAANIKDEKVPCWRRLFGCLMAKKPRWWCKRTARVSPVPEEQSQRKQCFTPPPQDKTEEVKEEDPVICHAHTIMLHALGNSISAFNPSVDTQQHNNNRTEHKDIKITKARLGFPNPGNNCYLNSCLQSLLTLEDFAESISSQEQVLTSMPDAAVMRLFMDIKRSRFSRNKPHKLSLLLAFKRTVSVWDPEFQDLHQKDAHEFLTSVLNQMRFLEPQLQMMAASMGRFYTCPVENHLAFSMKSSRTCKSCGVKSTREEDYINLSLDLIPGGGRVDQMLEDYMKETDVEYKCKCGATTLSQRLSFVNLPKVLVLHLKRFRFTPPCHLKKVHDPVFICRELVVSSKLDSGCFSLVSVISHLGDTASSGHYICDSVDPDVGQEDPRDLWITCNDDRVTATTGVSVCDQRDKTSYILFYKKQE